MKSLHSALSEKMLWDGLKTSDKETINSLLTEPVWQLAPSRKELLNESTMVNYTEDIIALGFIKQGKRYMFMVGVVQHAFTVVDTTNTVLDTNHPPIFRSE